MLWWNSPVTCRFFPAPEGPFLFLGSTAATTCLYRNYPLGGPGMPGSLLISEALPLCLLLYSCWLPEDNLLPYESLGKQILANSFPLGIPFKIPYSRWWRPMWCREPLPESKFTECLFWKNTLRKASDSPPFPLSLSLSVHALSDVKYKAGSLASKVTEIL